MHIQVDVGLLFCMPVILLLWRLTLGLLIATCFVYFCALLTVFCTFVVHQMSDCDSISKYV